MNWFLKVLKQYADFKGRARRKEYWMFVLISTVISYLIMGIDYALNFVYTTDMGSSFYYMNSLYSLFVLIPSFAVLVRRLHDIGKSGWFFFIIFIPIVGFIWLLVLLCKNGDEGENKYGVDPKNPVSELDQIGFKETT